MTKAVLVFSAVSIFVVVLQGTVAPYITFAGAGLNLVVIFVAGIALQFGPSIGMAVGLAVGLLTDVVLGIAIGYYAIPLVIIGFLVGKFERRFFNDPFLVPVTVGLIAISIYEITLLLLARLVFGIWLGGVFLSTIAPTILINSLSMPLFLWCLRPLIPLMGALGRWKNE
ncbi:MAG: rod shape-determining protein MreD [bacterium]|nr:rod shape-determining protein MreD [bacterium]